MLKENPFPFLKSMQYSGSILTLYGPPFVIHQKSLIPRPTARFAFLLKFLSLTVFSDLELPRDRQQKFSFIPTSEFVIIPLV
jgi:hypothetical protein